MLPLHLPTNVACAGAVQEAAKGPVTARAAAAALVLSFLFPLTKSREWAVPSQRREQSGGEVGRQPEICNRRGGDFLHLLTYVS